MTQSDRLKFFTACGLAAAGMVLLLAVPASTYSTLLQGRMVVVHLVLELFAVMIGVLVVTVAWHTFERHEDRIANALLGGFVVVTACDLMHALTYRGMPDFLSESTTPRAIFFWLMGRSVEAVTLAAIAFKAVPRTTRRTSMLGGMLLATALVSFGSWSLENFPVTFVEGVGVTAFKAGYEYALCALNLLTTAVLWRRASAGDNPHQHTLLALSSMLVGIGGLAFTAFKAPSDFQNIAGHLYKVAAYALLYRATFITSIQAPYEALRRSEAELRESQARMTVMGANLPQSVIYQVVRNADGGMVFTQVSPAIERISGLRADEVMRNPALWYGQVLPEDLPGLAAAEQQSAATMQLFDHEARMRRADGQVRRMHFASAPRRLEDGRLAWDGIATDITERSEAQEARRQLEVQLREAQKMESIGTLASGIAHDFNNVLGAILGNAAMAREDMARGARDEALRGIDQVYKAGLRARELVNQILTFSRRQAPTRLAQPLRPVVEDSLALLRATLPASVEVRAEFADQALQALVDRTQLEQVVLNLCTNAWHAMGEHSGVIRLNLDAVPLSAEQAGPLGLAPGDYLRLGITDTGCGMDAATRQRVFEPFFTTKPAGTGTGLGLSVVHGIVKAHEGAISVESAPGRGTRFDVYLPALAAAQAGEPAPAPVPLPAPASGHGERVLYVDDDEVVSLMVERLLARAGYAATCLRDADEAAALLRQAPDAFDVVVTDYNMPQRNGLDLVRELHQLRPDLPAVLSSGAVSEALRAEALALGIVRVLEKQNSLEELAPAIEQALAQAARLRKQAPRLRLVQAP